MCSKCQPNGLRGGLVKEELLEIHDIALPWAGWFTYEVEWDPQSGIHWVTVVVKGDGFPMCYSVCEFQAFVHGLEVGNRRLGEPS